jgi:hypothetical protein
LLIFHGARHVQSFEVQTVRGRFERVFRVYLTTVLVNNHVAQESFS